MTLEPKENLDIKPSNVDTTFKEIKKILSDIKITLHKTNILLEDENPKFRLAIERLQSLWQRQSQNEKSS